MQLLSGRRRAEPTGIVEMGRQLFSLGGCGNLAVAGAGQRSEGQGALEDGWGDDDGALGRRGRRTCMGNGRDVAGEDKDGRTQRERASL